MKQAAAVDSSETYATGCGRIERIRPAAVAHFEKEWTVRILWRWFLLPLLSIAIGVGVCSWFESRQHDVSFLDAVFSESWNQ
jgi:hypothetical protein